MKRFLLFCLIPLLGFARAETPAAPLPTFLLVSPQGMDTTLVHRVQTWMATNLHYQVRSLSIPAWQGTNASEQIEVLQSLPGDNDLLMVVLANRLDAGKHAVLINEHAAGFINVPLLASENPETFARRLERQAMRLVAFALGVPPQPMPFCALAPYQSIEELDRIGRGFSPPAMAMYRQKLVELQLPLSPAGQALLPDVRITMPAFPSMPAPLPPPPVQD